MALYYAGIDATATATSSFHQPHQNLSTSSSNIPGPAAGQVSVEIFSISIICLSLCCNFFIGYRDWFRCGGPTSARSTSVSAGQGSTRYVHVCGSFLKDDKTIVT